MKQIVKLCAMLFCAMLWFSPAGAQQKTRIATDQVGVTIDKAVPVMARISVAENQATADGLKKISAAKTLKTMSRSAAKAGGDGTDFELRMKNPAQNTVYSETNTPTFEVDVVNGEDLVWGKEPGNYAMWVQIYTEDAYTDPRDGSCYRLIVNNTIVTETPALPQGKYHVVFTLLYALDSEGYYDYVLNSAGERISTEIDFTIAYGSTNDTMLVMKNPTQDIVYNETNTPTFELSVINGEDLVWGTAVGNNVVWLRVYAEEAYEDGNPVISEVFADTVYTLSKALPKGKYRAVFYLVSISEQQGYVDYVFNTVGAVRTGVSFTINYGEVHDPELIVSNPAPNTVYTETNTPTFEVNVVNGEDLVWGEEPGNYVMMVQICTEEAYNDPNGSFKRYFEPATTFTVKQALPQGKYRVTFNLMTVAEGEGYYYVRNVAGENIATEIGFTIAYGTTNDTMLVMKNPVKDTVYTKTNIPTFKVSVINGENLVWGEEVGENIIEMRIYSEDAYNNADVSWWIIQKSSPDTVFTLLPHQSLSNGKYRAVFRLASVTQRNDDGSYNYTYLTNATGRVETGVNFTIDYKYEVPQLNIKTPALDTVYNETNTPTFELSVLSGEDIVWGKEQGNYMVEMQVYTEEAYNTGGNSFLGDILTDTVYTFSTPLPQGKYCVAFTLMTRIQEVYYIMDKKSVNFTINYGDIHNPALTLLNPAQDTVYTETTTPTFVLSLDKGGHDISLSRGAGNAAIRIEIFKAGATESLFEEFFVDTTYKLADVNALDTGNYNVRFTLMQWVNGSMQPNYWPATERVTTEVNIRVACTEKPAERMIVPTNLSTRTHQDTVWFSWTSKEKVYQLQVTDAFGERVQNLKENAASEDSVTTVWVSKFAEGTYKWQLRAVAVSDGAVVDSSDWVEGEKFTVKYETPDLSVEDNILAEMNVYPNPTTGEFKVNVPVDAVVEIYAANGHRVAARRVVAGTESFALEASGMYFVRITANGKTAVRRIVVR